MSVLFKDLTSGELAAALAPVGLTPAVARRLQAAVLRTGRLPDRLHGVSPQVLEGVRGAAVVPQLQRVDRVVSAVDGFARYVFKGQEGDLLESVRIPLLHRAGDEKYVVCVSSQVGCAMGCAFCATGRMGIQRDLAAWEIVDQVLQIRADSEYPVRGVVFMGMGEPLLNYAAVIRAAHVLSEPCGGAIAAKAISISTVGIAPAIRRFTAERQPFRLIVSLTSADPEQRAALLPVERRHATVDLLAALRDYHAATGLRVTLAWTMLAGVNTREEDARQLADLLQGLPVKLDLIDVNDPTGQFQPPSPAELAAFRDALRRHLAAPVARRYSGGYDIRAACGMLAGAASRDFTCNLAKSSIDLAPEPA